MSQKWGENLRAISTSNSGDRSHWLCCYQFNTVAYVRTALLEWVSEYADRTDYTAVCFLMTHDYSRKLRKQYQSSTGKCDLTKANDTVL